PARRRAHPERERRCRRARSGRLGREHPALRRVDERGGEDARADGHALRATGRPRRARTRVERARRRGARAGGDALADRPRHRPQADRLDRGRRVRAAHVERPARRLPGAHRREDGAHRRRGLVRGGGGATSRVHHLRGPPRPPDARAAQLRSRPLARVGRLALPHADPRRERPGGSGLASLRTGAGGAPGGEAARPRRSHRQAGGGARDRSVGRRPAARADRGVGRPPPARIGAVARRPLRATAGSRRASTLVREANRERPLGPHPVIVTVTLNAAVDRTLTVPNVQLGHRHRASASFTSAGGKGINVARALKSLETPVIATGLAGGRTGERIVEELALEAILNDFVRISDESRTSTAVVDPTGGSLTEIYEWGPAVRPDELEMLLDKLRYLSRVASFVVFSGSL